MTPCERSAKNGGLVGIGFWKQATGTGDVEGIVRSIRYAVDLIGVEHVGIGSDFDGSVQVPFDVSQLSLLTAVLVKNGFSTNEIRFLMGANFYRFLQQQLPKNE